MKRIYLKHGKEESLLRRHPWVFSGALQHADTPIDDGQTVQVFDSNGRYMATGHYQPSSIAVRILTFDNETIDRTFWQRRLQAAYLLRQTAGLLSRPDTNAYRLVHGEGDLLPGLVIDVYGHTAVMQAHSTGMHLARHEIAAALQ